MNRVSAFQKLSWGNVGRDRNIMGRTVLEKSCSGVRLRLYWLRKSNCEWRYIVSNISRGTFQWRVRTHCSNYIRFFFKTAVNPSPLVPRICVSELGHHWFRKRLVAYPVPSYYLYQCWLIVNWTPRNKFQWYLNRNSIILIQENDLKYRQP